MLFLSYLLSRYKGERWEEEIFQGEGIWGQDRVVQDECDLGTLDT